MDSPYVPIPREDLPAMIDKPIHLRWASYGCVWILERIEGDTMYLRTPKTRKRRTAQAYDACYCNKDKPEGGDRG